MGFSTSIFVILTLIPLAASTCGDVQTFKLCYNTYLQNFELSTDPFPEYRAYKMVREMMLVEEGPTGQTKECGYQNGLTGCFAALEADCVVTENLATVFNISTAEATNFVQDYYMMKYTCNDGYSAAMKYFYCLEQVGLYHTDSLVNCSTVEQTALANGVGCSAYNDYIGCLTNVYVAQCGADVQNYICNLEVSGISHAAPDCAGSLTQCSSTSKVAAKKFHRRRAALARRLRFPRRASLKTIARARGHIFP